MKKKQFEKLEALVANAQSNCFDSCSFTGGNYDAKAVEAIQTIALGLVANAEALGKLAEVLKASNVYIDALVKA